MDINPDLEAQGLTNLTADFKAMPFDDESVDILIFDPPHIPTDGVTEGSSKLYYDKYGITEKRGEGRDGNKVSGLFAPFLSEAQRVLKPNGIILAEIADLVHCSVSQWQQVDFINAVFEAGLTPCDMLIKADPSAGNMMSGAWKNVFHLRKAHCYWIVVRKGKCTVPHDNQ